MSNICIDRHIHNIFDIYIYIYIYIYIHIYMSNMSNKYIYIFIYNSRCKLILGLYGIIKNVNYLLEIYLYTLKFSHYLKKYILSFCNIIFRVSILHLQYKKAISVIHQP